MKFEPIAERSPEIGVITEIPVLSSRPAKYKMKKTKHISVVLTTPT